MGQSRSAARRAWNALTSYNQALSSCMHCLTFALWLALHAASAALPLHPPVR